MHSRRSSQRGTYFLDRHAPRKRVCKDAGLDPMWRLHDLRHWSATHAIAGGHDVRSVAPRLGHADPTTTMRTYAHALEGRDTAIADTLATVLDGHQPM